MEKRERVGYSLHIGDIEAQIPALMTSASGSCRIDYNYTAPKASLNKKCCIYASGKLAQETQGRTLYDPTGQRSRG